MLLGFPKGSGGNAYVPYHNQFLLPGVVPPPEVWWVYPDALVLVSALSNPFVGPQVSIQGTSTPPPKTVSSTFYAGAPIAVGLPRWQLPDIDVDPLVFDPHWPIKCPRCKGPAYQGAGAPDCKRKCS